jgi:hypothetical protein
MMEPEGKIAAVVDQMRALAFFKYISLLKSPLVNLTNMATAGAPRLAQDIGPVADAYMTGAFATASKWKAGLKSLKTDEMRLLTELVTDGTIQSQFLEEMRSAFKGSGFKERMGQIAKPFMFLMRETEMLSRAGTALAAYRSAKDGKIRSERAARRYGFSDPTMKIKEPTELQYQRLKLFVEEIVNDSHGIWGKVNRPQIARGKGAGEIVGGAYIFETFSQNLFHMWSNMWRTKSWDSKYALGRSLAITGVLGGLHAILGWETLKMLYALLVPDKWKKTPDLDMLAKEITGAGTWLTRGLPAYLGFDVSSSYSMDPDYTVEGMLGVSHSMVKDLVQAKEAVSVGEYMRALEYVIPLKAARDFLVAQRLNKEGMTSLSGSFSAREGEAEPMKISTGEAVKQFLGFTPMDVTNMREKLNLSRSLQENRLDKQNEYAARYTNALRRDDDAEIERVLNEMIDWNDFWLERDRVDMVLDLRDSVRARMRPRRGPRRARMMEQRIEESLW